MVVRKEVNSNVFINFQVTLKRGGLLKATRLERKNKYSVDQNERVRVSEYFNFELVKSEESLQKLIKNSPISEARVDRRAM